MSTIDNDAHEFGLHVRQGGWRLGLLVARSVDPKSKGGRPSKTSDSSEVSRVSFVTFGKLSGISDKTVARYHAAWEAAANDGLVPYSDELIPGDEFEFGFDVEDDDSPKWSKYYSAAKPKTEPAPSPAPVPAPAPRPEPAPLINIVDETYPEIEPVEPLPDNVLEPSISLPVKEFEDLVAAIRSQQRSLSRQDCEFALVEANQILDAIKGLIEDLELLMVNA